MKTFTFATAALVAALSATSAFAGDNNYSGDREYLAHRDSAAVDYNSTASTKTTDKSGFITTYPTNADSVINETPAQRNVMLGRQNSN